MTVFGLFYYVVDVATLNFSRIDSLRGKVTKIDTLTSPGTAIVDLSLPLPFVGQKLQFYITSDKDNSANYAKNKIFGSGGAPISAYNFFTFNLARCPDKINSVKSSSWSGKVRPGTETAQNPQYYYPDLSAIAFGDTEEQFFRNGKIITYTLKDKVDPVKILYRQNGSMVFFYGYDEIYDKIYPYFGVLAPDGKTMMVDAWAVDQSKYGYGSPRLPNYVDTNAPYGPNGVTPVIFKQ
ncbi:hypothetical protein DBR11_08100 [Pedobacter sp. HMWF019]|nr:hypothetical protein DBR11_08100 [Pedobacter sp. HMWF019]